MNDILTSVIRTLTPIIAGWILALPVTAWLGLDETAVTMAVAGGLAALYHTAVRLLESRWPSAGQLLGAARQPSYTKQAPLD